MKIFGDNYAAQLSLVCKGKRKRVVCFFICCFVFVITGFAQNATLSGKITDTETGEPLIFGTIVVYQNDTLIAGAEADFEGYYLIPLEKGIYNIEFSYVGYKSKTFKNIFIANGEHKEFSAALDITELSCCTLYQCNWNIPTQIAVDIFEDGRIFNSDDIERRGGRN